MELDGEVVFALRRFIGEHGVVVVAFLESLFATADIGGFVIDGPVEPRTQRGGFGELVGVFGERYEGLLGGIFREGVVVQGASGNGIDESPMFLHQLRECLFVPRLCKAGQEFGVGGLGRLDCRHLSDKQSPGREFRQFGRSFSRRAKEKQKSRVCFP